MPPNLVLVVTGSRGLDSTVVDEHDEVWSALTEKFGRKFLYHGAARGIDLAVAAKLEARGWDMEPFKVEDFSDNWETVGKVAGHLRNRRMLEAAEARAKAIRAKLLLVSLWDGASPGTENMMKLATRWSVDHWPLVKPLAGQKDVGQSSLF